MTELVVCDLAIVGAGPAGMAAAVAARRHGLSVAVLDDKADAGGQVWRALRWGVENGFARRVKLDIGRGTAAITQFDASGTSHARSARVCAIGADHRVVAKLPAGMLTIQPRHILLAVGALERPVPIPGWTLPGVMTVGALQILLKSAALAPAAPCILAGSGPLLYLVAAQLTRLGRPPAAVLDTAMRPTLRAIAAMPAGLWAARRQLIIGAGLMATLVKARVPVWHGAGEIEAHGDGKLAGITFRARGRTHALDAEVLGLHGGLMPNIQLSAALDLPHDYDPLRRYWLPCADTWGQTSRPGISVAGDCAGIVGAAGSEADGELAAAGVAAQLGRISADERDRVTRTLHQRQRKLRSAQQTLEAVFPPWQLPGPIPPTTVICRCESVSVGDIRVAVRAGARNAAEAKTFTRCGMGPCQGRMCGTLLSQVLADALTKPAADVGFLKPRWPLEPIDFASLAALDEQVS